MGHTDYLNEKIEGSSVMMMVSESLRVALLTEHLSLSKVTSSISKDLVENRTKSIHKTLQLDFILVKNTMDMQHVLNSILNKIDL